MSRERRGNVDEVTVESFGREWARFDQTGMTPLERRQHFDAYFAVFPWDALPEGAEGFDAGCGSGRWAMEVAPRVGVLHCVDAAAEALDVARVNLADQANCRFHHASVEAIPVPDGSMDFGYSLGVLHHIPDPAAGMRACASKLKPGAPFLVYLYYALDGRPAWFRALWRLSDAVRKVVMRLPFRLKVIASTVIAAVAYFPFARIALLAERAGINVHHFPLATYRDRSFYSMRTDALDRFGTQLEYRFTADGVRDVMTQAGLERIELSQSAPYWCAVGYRAADHSDGG